MKNYSIIIILFFTVFSFCQNKKNVSTVKKSYITNKNGVWVKDMPNGKNLFFTEFNTEIELIKDRYITVEGANLPDRWWFIQTKNKKGWVHVKNIGSKWLPDDDDLIKRTTSLIKTLKEEKPITFFMNDKFTIIYHEDNRCDGSTDGVLNNVNKHQIEKEITIAVLNDGKGWMCDEKKSKTYNLQFSLSKLLKGWDRFEVQQYNIKNKIAYIVGNGESDYLVIHFKKVNKNYLIHTLEYRSEDPG